MNVELRKAANVKARLWNKYLSSKTGRNWELFRKQRNITAAIRRRSIQNYFSERCDGGPQNKNFFKTIKPFLSNKAHVQSDIMLEIEGSVTSDQNKISEHFNKFFVNIASSIGDEQINSENYNSVSDYVDKCVTHYENHPSVLMINDNFNKCNFEFRSTTPNEMASVLSKLDATKATGPDLIPTKIVKYCKDIFLIPLCNIFNSIIRSRIFPSIAKLANIIPIFKKEDALFDKNYRPVSILSCFSKVFERLLSLQLSTFLNSILHERIAAFRRGHSCEAVLTRLVEDWKRALDDGRSISVIMMDLSKAFDCMPHSLLIAKLQAYGMGRQAVEIFASYLTGRSQRVKLQSVESEWRQALKGVPQGSILGPILFNLFINDLYGFIKEADLSNYADDNTVSAVGKDVQTAVDLSKSETEVAISWFTNNQMEANAPKFHHILITNAKSVPDYEMKEKKR